MQFHHHGYVSTDPRVQPARGAGIDRRPPARGGTWLNPQPEPPRPARQCPANTMPNPRGTGCVPVARPPNFGTPRPTPFAPAHGPTVR